MTRLSRLRTAMARRSSSLAAALRSPLLRRVGRVFAWGAGLSYFVFVALALLLRYALLPQIETYRPQIERLLSQGMGQEVCIGRIEAHWQGINPDLTLFDVHVADGEGRPALAFSRIEAILSWWSLPSAQLTLDLLRIDEPQLNLRRDAQGRIFIAGIPLAQDQDDRSIMQWILAQQRIRIHGAKIVWDDELRGAPTLVLDAVNLALDNDWRRHRFGLTAQPPAALASRIDLRGNFWGSDVRQMRHWDGSVFAQVDYVDLAVWRQWIDYPVDLPHGRGALRSWLEFSAGQLAEVTADVALQDVGLRLSPDVPSIDLETLSGRVGGRLGERGFVAYGRALELLTRHAADARGVALRIEPTDFRVEWQRQDDASNTGRVSANRLDLDALSRLVEYLPLDAQTRRLLKDYAPHGTISALSARWTGDAERLRTYALKAGFADLAVRAQGDLPGFSGLSGSVQANEKSGQLVLRAQDVRIDLPRVFPEAQSSWDTLRAQLKWTSGSDGLRVHLAQSEFAGPDAAGSARGVYRHTGEGPGFIDLNASLSRGDARAVWRYMPHAVGAGARHWLRDSLLAGSASEARLALKGDLRDFPFVDKSKGQFLVTVKAQDVVLDYARGWPRIDGIHGQLRFEGNGMVVDAQRAAILGARLTKTRVEIPDFDKPISTLLVKGQADGASSEFLKFIEQSPVAERIDRFTDGMRASGNGRLDLRLRIPLDEAYLGRSEVEGSYRFLNNEVSVDTALPPIRQVNGMVQFTGRDLRVPEITGILFGGPLRIRGGLQKDGKVLIAANGTFNVEQMRRQSDSPLLSRLSGSAPYRGEVRINRRNADLVVDSNMVGVAANLPEPLKKDAGEALPLRFEKRLLPLPAGRKAGSEVATRDRIALTLGNILSLQLVRRQQGEGFVPERGVLAVGTAPVLPEKGFAVNVAAHSIDLDAWRGLLQGAPANSATATSPAAPFVPDTVSLKSADVLFFGRHVNEVDVLAQPFAAGWKIRLDARQACGELQWNGSGSGKLSARLKQLALESSAAAEEPEAGSERETDLPALDIVVDDFSVGVRRFGRLELQARNDGGAWRLNKVQMMNPYGVLNGSGQWQVATGKGKASSTRLDFRVDSPDVGKLLDRLGYVGAVHAATAKLEGKMNWKGSPLAFNFASLNGEMNLQAGKGQFVKIDPGGAGKLIGLISLQSLPRRISLDFKDVFSEGFAFDSMNSKLLVQNGVMRTDRLQIDGPSARVVMRGEVDLKHETQYLTVNVQPEIGSTAALGIALVNPVAGVASLLAHKVLQNPLNQMFGYHYRVTGTWDDPKVDKVSGAEQGTGATVPAGGERDSSAQ